MLIEREYFLSFIKPGAWAGEEYRIMEMHDYHKRVNLVLLRCYSQYRNSLFDLNGAVRFSTI